jgi:hypothetical protein
LPFDIPPLNVSLKITVEGVIKFPLTAAGRLKLIAGCIPVNIVSVAVPLTEPTTPVLLKEAPPSVL